VLVTGYGRRTREVQLDLGLDTRLEQMPDRQPRLSVPRVVQSRLSGGINRCEAKASRMRSAARVASFDPGATTARKYPAAAPSTPPMPGWPERRGRASALAIQAEESRVGE
jgi:hypothetical protein